MNSLSYGEKLQHYGVFSSKSQGYKNAHPDVPALGSAQNKITQLFFTPQKKVTE